MQRVLLCSVVLVVEGEWQGKKMEESRSWCDHENWSREVESTIISFSYLSPSCPQAVTNCEILTVSL